MTPPNSLRERERRTRIIRSNYYSSMYYSENVWTIYATRTRTRTVTEDMNLRTVEKYLLVATAIPERHESLAF